MRLLLRRRSICRQRLWLYVTPLSAGRLPAADERVRNALDDQRAAVHGVSRSSNEAIPSQQCSMLTGAGRILGG